MHGGQEEGKEEKLGLFFTVKVGRSCYFILLMVVMFVPSNFLYPPG